MEYARSVGVGAVPQARPEPTVVVDERLDLTIGGRDLQLIATPGGETFDSLVVWLPESRTLFSGNLFGPLFGHVPNLVTIRGDRYRDALTYVDSLEVVLDLGPDRLITGHFDPIVGAASIADEVRAMQEAMRWVHVTASVLVKVPSDHEMPRRVSTQTASGCVNSVASEMFLGMPASMDRPRSRRTVSA